MEYGYWQMQRQIRGLSPSAEVAAYHRLELPTESLDHLHYLQERMAEVERSVSTRRGVAHRLRKAQGDPLQTSGPIAVAEDSLGADCSHPEAVRSSPRAYASEAVRAESRSGQIRFPARRA